MPVYHKDVGFPDKYKEKLYWFNAELNQSPTRFTSHYAQNDGRDQSTDRFFKYVQLKVGNIFEFTTNEGGKIEKAVYRYPYLAGSGVDICFSVSGGNGAKNIITFWFNSTGDTHNTLDTSRYSVAKLKYIQSCLQKFNNISESIFKFLQENYLVDRGDCVSIALALKNIFGGNLYAIYRDDEPEYPLHVVLNLNGIFIDGNGTHSKEKLLSLYSGYDEETEQDEQAYMFEYDDIQAENLADEKKVNNIIMQLKKKFKFNTR